MGFVLLFLKFLEDISPFCGATDTPVLDFWWCLPWSFKARVIPCVFSRLRDPQIHLCCDTYWLYRVQYTPTIKMLPMHNGLFPFQLFTPGNWHPSLNFATSVTFVIVGNIVNNCNLQPQLILLSLIPFFLSLSPAPKLTPHSWTTCRHFWNGLSNNNRTSSLQSLNWTVTPLLWPESFVTSISIIFTILLTKVWRPPLFYGYFHFENGGCDVNFWWLVKNFKGTEVIKQA